MKTKFLTLACFFALVTITGCKKDKANEAATGDAEKVTVAEKSAQKFKVNTDSSIEWKGFKPTGSHNGTIAVESGVFTLTDGKIQSGTFIIDMNSIVVTDIPAEEEGNASLTGHLKSGDFFNVEQFPNAAFEVTGMETKDGNAMLSGNLKLKDKQNNITFPVTVSEQGDEISITSEKFTIDRSKWDVKYGSKSFFDDLGDKFINDDIELKINLTAKKA
ncbi:YceI family protein [Winogradskyella sp. 3972H.M.0a.05]|uniref:YceI family protein n=1 Tax=Winogradskyella sp. 3972H.M.0a.05 TaxID=2950277 RepID=UPI0033997653